MEKLIEILKQNNLVIPNILFLNYKKLNITEKELIILIYLINCKDLVFNPKNISTTLSEPLNVVMDLISSLNEKGLLSIDIIKVNNSREELINLDNLYSKLSFLILEDDKKTESKSSLYDTFEKEFGRTLSSIEYELINGWKEADYSEEIIICALKEAVFNGVSNLRYIDKILYEWKKKGIKSSEDILKNQKKFRENKASKELFEYDWLNENE